MEPGDFTLMYARLESEISELFDKRTELEIQLADVNKKIEHIQLTMQRLAPLTGLVGSVFDDITDLGITDAVRSVLDPNRKMSPAEIKEAMQQRGYDFTKYSAPDASIRTVLKRLVEAGKAEEHKEAKKVFYTYMPTDEEIPF
jgi:hypothetical protein